MASDQFSTSRSAPSAARAPMKRLRREGFVPGVVYGGRDGDCTSFKVDARALRQVLVGGSGADRPQGRQQDPPGDREGPAAAPGPRRGHAHRPARGAPGREDPDDRRRARRGRRGVARRQGGRRARARDPPAQHRGAADRHPGLHRRRRLRHGDRRDHAPLRGHRARGRRPSSTTPRRRSSPRSSSPPRSRSRRSRRRRSWSARTASRSRRAPSRPRARRVLPPRASAAAEEAEGSE